MTLYIDRWTILAQHRQIADAIMDTMLPTFGNIDLKVQKFRDDLEARDFCSNDPCRSEEEWQAEQITFFDDGLRSVETEMAGIAVAALYHLWERSIITLMRLNGNSIKNGVYKDTEYFLKNKDLHEDCKAAFSDINRGRLISNVVKHGAGSSAEELYKLEPKLFGIPWDDDCFNIPSKCDVRLIFPQCDHVRKLAAAITTFWKTLPDNFFPKQLPPWLRPLPTQTPC